MNIQRKDIKPELFNNKPNPPNITDLRVEVENEFVIAFDKSKPFTERVKAFVRGENKAGRGVGMIIDFISIFLPSSITKPREAAQLIINKTNKNMPTRIKPYLKQESTWEGIAAVLGAIGIVIQPDAMVMIVVGVFSIIGGIRLWKKETEEV